MLRFVPAIILTAPLQALSDNEPTDQGQNVEFVAGGKGEGKDAMDVRVRPALTLFISLLLTLTDPKTNPDPNTYPIRKGVGDTVGSIVRCQSEEGVRYSKRIVSNVNTRPNTFNVSGSRKSKA